MQDQPIPVGLCQCGCGAKTRIPTKDDRWNGQTAGIPLRYRKGHSVTHRSEPVIDRIYAKIKVHPLGCWEWRGYLNPRGYAVTRPTGMYNQMVHRIVYEEEVGPIPEGLTIDHLCMNKRCCNWAHLEVVTRAENVRRGWQNGLMRYPGVRPTRCIHGHPYDEANSYLHPSNGKRQCRECNRIRDRERYRAKQLLK